MIDLFQKHNELSKKHEIEMAEMEMQMLQTLLLSTMGQHSHAIYLSAQPTQYMHMQSYQLNEMQVKASAKASISDA